MCPSASLKQPELYPSKVVAMIGTYSSQLLASWSLLGVQAPAWHTFRVRSSLDVHSLVFLESQKLSYIMS